MGQSSVAAFLMVPSGRTICVTRGQMIKVAVALLGRSGDGVASYSDVTPSAWYDSWGAQAEQIRLIGQVAAYPLYGGELLEADQPATRAKAALLLANLLELKGK